MIAAVGTRCSGARKGGGVLKRPGQRLHVFPSRPKCPSKDSQSCGMCRCLGSEKFRRRPYYTLIENLVALFHFCLLLGEMGRSSSAIYVNWKSNC